MLDPVIKNWITKITQHFDFHYNIVPKYHAAPHQVKVEGINHYSLKYWVFELTGINIAENSYEQTKYLSEFEIMRSY
jgi:hypothetical protein